MIRAGLDASFWRKSMASVPAYVMVVAAYCSSILSDLQEPLSSAERFYGEMGADR